MKTVLGLLGLKYEKMHNFFKEDPHKLSEVPP
jgi:hypothetical protein